MIPPIAAIFLIVGGCAAKPKPKPFIPAGDPLPVSIAPAPEVPQPEPVAQYIPHDTSNTARIVQIVDHLNLLVVITERGRVSTDSDEVFWITDFNTDGLVDGWTVSFQDNEVSEASTKRYESAFGPRTVRMLRVRNSYNLNP